MMTVRMTFMAASLLVMSETGAIAQGSVTLLIADRLGRAYPAAFSIAGPDGTIIARSGEAAKPVRVQAGTWQLVPEGHSRLARQISVADAQELKVDITAPGGVWLLIDPSYDGPPQRVLIVPKDRPAMQTALATFDLSRRYNEPLAARRPGVGPEAASAALALARATYGKPSADASDAAAAQRTNAHIWAGRIMSALGDATDVARLTADPAPYDQFSDLLIAARIEQRLGTIDRGRLAALADGTSSNRAIYAAVLLLQAGVGRADHERLGQALLNPPVAPGPALAWLAALSLRSPAVDRSFQAALDRLLARAAQISTLPQKERESAYNEHSAILLPLVLHALINGNDDQLRKLADFEITSFDSASLAPFVANPDALARFYMLRSQSKNPDDFLAISEVATLCPIIETVPASEGEQLWRALASAVREAGAREAVRRTNLAPGVARGIPDNFADYFSASASACRPSLLVAYRVFENMKSVPFTSWIPRPDMQDELVGYLRKPQWVNFNWRRVDMVLETIPIERLEAALAAKGAASPPYPFDIYLAYRRVATRANYLYAGYHESGSLGAMRRGLTSRPYVFAAKSYDGGVAGIASVRVEAREDATRFHLRLNQQAHYGSSGLIETRRSRAEWKFHPYTLDRGRQLIREVKLLKANAPIAIKEIAADANGDPVFETPRIESWAETVLQVDLGMFEERRSLLFELYAADLPTR